MRGPRTRAARTGAETMDLQGVRDLAPASSPREQGRDGERRDPPPSLLLSFSLSALQTSPLCTASCNALCIGGASGAFSAPAPDRSRSRTGACAEKRRARCCPGRTRHQSGTAPTHPPSPQPHEPLATRSARYTRSSVAPEREAHGRAYPQHPAP